MGEIESSLATVQSGLERLGRSTLLELLRPGLSAARVRAALSARGLHSARDLEAWYEWHDGTNFGIADAGVIADDIHMMPGFYFVPLDRALADFDGLRTDPRWTAGWFPLLANGGGDFYVVDGSGAVRHFRIDEQVHPVEFNSLSDFTRTLSHAFVSGVFYVSSDGYLEMDDMEYAALARKLNPGVAWWSESL